MHPDMGRSQGERAARKRSVEGEPGGATFEAEDMQGEVAAWVREHAGRRAAREGAVLVLRPDRYVFAVAGRGELAATTAQARVQICHRAA